MLKRIGLYLWVMFPPRHILPCILLALSFFCALCKFNHFHLTFALIPALTTLSIVLFMLLLRVMDEFKDYEDDLINYPERPLPSGRVKHADLRPLLAGIFLLILALNLYNTTIFVGALGVLGYSTLMFKWFFFKDKIRSSLPLALITHNPIVYIYFIYLFLAYTQMDPGYSPLSLLIILPLGAAITNWEISRKIRLAENESSYTTYSKIWGRKGAVAIALGLQMITLLGGIIFLVAVGTSWYLTSSFAAAFFLIALKYVQFTQIEADPDGRWDKIIPLRKYAEWQGMLIQLTMIVAYFIH